MAQQGPMQLCPWAEVHSTARPVFKAGTGNNTMHRSVTGERCDPSCGWGPSRPGICTDADVAAFQDRGARITMVRMAFLSSSLRALCAFTAAARSMLATVSPVTCAAPISNLALAFARAQWRRVALAGTHKHAEGEAGLAV